MSESYDISYSNKLDKEGRDGSYKKYVPNEMNASDEKDHSSNEETMQVLRRREAGPSSSHIQPEQQQPASPRSHRVRSQRQQNASHAQQQQQPQSEMNFDLKQFGFNILQAGWNVFWGGWAIMSSIIYSIFGDRIDKLKNSDWATFFWSKVNSIKSWAADHDSELKGVGGFIARFAGQLALLAFASARFIFYSVWNFGKRVYQFMNQNTSGVSNPSFQGNPQTRQVPSQPSMRQRTKTPVA